MLRPLHLGSKAGQKMWPQEKPKVQSLRASLSSSSLCSSSACGKAFAVGSTLTEAKASSRRTAQKWSIHSSFSGTENYAQGRGGALVPQKADVQNPLNNCQACPPANQHRSGEVSFHVSSERNKQRCKEASSGELLVLAEFNCNLYSAVPLHPLRPLLTLPFPLSLQVISVNTNSVYSNSLADSFAPLFGSHGETIKLRLSIPLGVFFCEGTNAVG